MSYLQGFNYTYSPNLGSFTQVPFSAPNRFSAQPLPQNFQQYSSGFGGPGPTPPGANIPIPQSINQNSQSYTDYYGNPSQAPPQQNLQEQYYEPQQQQYSAQPPPQPQQGRRRRVKNARKNTLPVNYGQEHVQQAQAAQFYNQQQIPPPQQNQQNHQDLGLTPSGTDHLRVTPIQGPIFAKDGHVPVVPLYSYPHVRNGTFYQIPILWTALSYALGLEIRGEIIRGLPCIKRLNQLFCPTAGNTYPLDHIERFIDENKALIKRMYGEFIMNSESLGGPLGGNALRRSAREVYEHEVEEMFGKSATKNQVKNGDFIPKGNDTSEGEHVRKARQTVNPRNGSPTQQPKSNRVDSCESTVEITTPYWAANSAGKVRAIVNTQHFEQAIHQEVCSKTSTKRCTGECGCEQKYKWHRLLAYDPDNDCRGIFMDWFLFPSCCVCRCNPQ